MPPEPVRQTVVTHPVSLTGGAYPGFSGDVEVFHHIFGIGGEVFWKASQADR